MTFEASLRNSDDGMAIIDLRGDITSAADEALDTTFTRAESEGTQTVLLNFSDVGYINSSGIALVVSLLARSRQAGGALMACGLSDHYREIFEITRLADLIQVFPDEASAIAGSPSG